MLIGALFIGVVAGLVSAGIVLATGGGILAALGVYMLAGTGGTLAVLTLKLMAGALVQTPAQPGKPVLR